MCCCIYSTQSPGVYSSSSARSVYNMATYYRQNDQHIHIHKYKSPNIIYTWRYTHTYISSLKGRKKKKRHLFCVTWMRIFLLGGSIKKLANTKGERKPKGNVYIRKFSRITKSVMGSALEEEEKVEYNKAKNDWIVLDASSSLSPSSCKQTTTRRRRRRRRRPLFLSSFPCGRKKRKNSIRISSSSSRSKHVRRV